MTGAGADSVFVAGGVAWNTMVYLDSLPQPHGQTLFSKGYHETVGATGAGKALNLAALDRPVTLHAMIGDDAPGREIRSRLDAAGVSFLADIDPKGTERHLNLMARVGARISIYTGYATFEPDIDLGRIERAIAQHDVLALNINNYCRRLIPAARAHGRPIWCDIHDYDGHDDYHRDFIEAADVLFLSSDALPDYRDFMAAQIAAGKSLVVCTHGNDGATALTTTNDWLQQPVADGFERVDTNGAGDAFFAGFLSTWLDGGNIRQCLRAASVVAGLCVTSRELASPDLSPERLASELRRLGW